MRKSVQVPQKKFSLQNSKSMKPVQQQSRKSVMGRQSTTSGFKANSKKSLTTDLLQQELINLNSDSEEEKDSDFDHKLVMKIDFVQPLQDVLEYKFLYSFFDKGESCIPSKTSEVWQNPPYQHLNGMEFIYRYNDYDVSYKRCIYIEVFLRKIGEEHMTKYGWTVFKYFNIENKPEIGQQQLPLYQPHLKQTDIWKTGMPVVIKTALFISTTKPSKHDIPLQVDELSLEESSEEQEDDKKSSDSQIKFNEEGKIDSDNEQKDKKDDKIGVIDENKPKDRRMSRLDTLKKQTLAFNKDEFEENIANLPEDVKEKKKKANRAYSVEQLKEIQRQKELNKFRPKDQQFDVNDVKMNSADLVTANYKIPEFHKLPIGNTEIAMESDLIGVSVGGKAKEAIINIDKVQQEKLEQEKLQEQQEREKRLAELDEGERKKVLKMINDDGDNLSNISELDNQKRSIHDFDDTKTFCFQLISVQNVEVTMETRKLAVQFSLKDRYNDFKFKPSIAVDPKTGTPQDFGCKMIVDWADNKNAEFEPYQVWFQISEKGILDQFGEKKLDQMQFEVKIRNYHFHIKLFDEFNNLCLGIHEKHSQKSEKKVCKYKISYEVRPKLAPVHDQKVVLDDDDEIEDTSEDEDVLQEKKLMEIEDTKSKQSSFPNLASAAQIKSKQELKEERRKTKKIRLQDQNNDLSASDSDSDEEVEGKLKFTFIDIAQFLEQNFNYEYQCSIAFINSAGFIATDMEDKFMHASTDWVLFKEGDFQLDYKKSFVFEASLQHILRQYEKLELELYEDEIENPEKYQKFYQQNNNNSYQDGSGSPGQNSPNTNSPGITPQQNTPQEGKKQLSFFKRKLSIFNKENKVYTQENVDQLSNDIESQSENKDQKRQQQRRSSIMQMQQQRQSMIQQQQRRQSMLKQNKVSSLFNIIQSQVNKSKNEGSPQTLGGLTAQKSEGGKSKFNFKIPDEIKQIQLSHEQQLQEIKERNKPKALIKIMRRKPKHLPENLKSQGDESQQLTINEEEDSIMEGEQLFAWTYLDLLNEDGEINKHVFQLDLYEGPEANIVDPYFEETKQRVLKKKHEQLHIKLEDLKKLVRFIDMLQTKISLIKVKNTTDDLFYITSFQANPKGDRDTIFNDESRAMANISHNSFANNIEKKETLIMDELSVETSLSKIKEQVQTNNLNNLTLKLEFFNPENNRLIGVTRYPVFKKDEPCVVSKSLNIYKDNNRLESILQMKLQSKQVKKKLKLDDEDKLKYFEVNIAELQNFKVEKNLTYFFMVSFQGNCMEFNFEKLAKMSSSFFKPNINDARLLIDDYIKIDIPIFDLKEYTDLRMEDVYLNVILFDEDYEVFGMCKHQAFNHISELRQGEFLLPVEVRNKNFKKKCQDLGLGIVVNMQNRTEEQIMEDQNKLLELAKEAPIPKQI